MTHTPPATHWTSDDLADLLTYLTPEEQASLGRLLHDPAKERERYRTDPVAFAEEVLGFVPAPYQRDILESVVAKRRVCVRSLHGAGKTGIAAVLVLWFVAVHDECKVPTTASAWRQLTEYLWPEIHKWGMQGRWEKVGLQVRINREMQSRRLVVSPTAMAFAVTSSDEAKIEGAHAAAILYLFDEAKTIPDAIWDAAEGAMSTGNCYAVALSTPGDSKGRFFDIQSRKPGYEDWHTIHVGLAECVAAGRVTLEWAEQRKRAWGEHSALYQRRVLGNFAEDDAETLITLTMVEQAQKRWEAREQMVRDLVAAGVRRRDAYDRVWGPMTRLGVDPARFGRDKTGWAFAYAYGIQTIETTERKDTAQTGARVSRITAKNTAEVFVDAIGVGAGTVDHLHMLWRDRKWRTDSPVPPVRAVHAGVKTTLRDQTGEFGFSRLRSWLWWRLREILDDPASDFCLPPDDELVEELLTAKYDYGPDGRTITVTDKDRMRDALPGRRSPDKADAIMLTLLTETPPRQVVFDFF